jgi:hypothetical protein
MSDEDFLAPAQFTDEPQDETATEPTNQPEPEVSEAPAAEKPEQTTVPLAALQSERAENRSLKARIPALEQKIESLMDMVQRATTPKPEPIDPITDPDRYAQAIQAQMAMIASNTTATVSEKLTRSQVGDAIVDEAFEAAQQAGVVDSFRGRQDPWGDLVKWHKTQKVQAEIGNDPEAYRERIRQQVMQELAAGQSANLRPAPSLAGQSNLGTRNAPAWSGPTPLDDILGVKGSSF